MPTLAIIDIQDKILAFRPHVAFEWGLGGGFASIP